MFDAKKLLDALVGSAAAGSHGKPADAGLGNMLNDVLGQFTGGAGAGGNIAEKAMGYLNTPQGNMATSAVIGGLAGLLMGSKSGRKLAGSAAKLGGLALIGGLAYTAYRNWKAGQQPAASAATQADGGTPMLAPPSQSPFSADSASQDTALVLLRAMIAAAAADGHIDTQERGRIIGGLKQAGFDIEATQFLDSEFANPASITTLASAARTPELASEIYTAARLAIEPDTPEEKAFLAQLGDALGLDRALIAHIDAAATAAKA
ncbi:tellurite resistance TerB family protein [Chelatococcus composti]|jgi:Uncharacterized protein conserved in bacteria|uniref:Uncharacterized membrane protein YebE (DUF533 family) n=1 Tax=Chelatococcus composti TaxID=1743235 RepID=A0A841K5E2_9HYPH|nr:DUF533 domain-containing protein [Chelatococcus composti]MBB6167701.1 uncharacterized membrane protein YebE (DUF533 family) [Chelatococcus composti]MBS7735098.1 DUF533 domain-containing protein [Chelatococcus composti]PZN45660.1 MAG: DUF533 domain-containing protein [Pseudomonadota bacterium]GGG36655.1 protein YebE [Chelatococcus composti]